MAGKQRKKSRCGRHLSPVPSKNFIEKDSDFEKENQSKEALGFKLNETVRPYLSVKGIVSLRFVWRKRERDLNVTITQVIRFPFKKIVG